MKLLRVGTLKVFPDALLSFHDSCQNISLYRNTCVCVCIRMCLFMYMYICMYVYIKDKHNATKTTYKKNLATIEGRCFPWLSVKEHTAVNDAVKDCL